MKIELPIPISVIISSNTTVLAIDKDGEIWGYEDEPAQKQDLWDSDGDMEFVGSIAGPVTDWKKHIYDVN